MVQLRQFNKNESHSIPLGMECASPFLPGFLPDGSYKVITGSEILDLVCHDIILKVLIKSHFQNFKYWQMAVRCFRSHTGSTTCNCTPQITSSKSKRSEVVINGKGDN